MIAPDSSANVVRALSSALRQAGSPAEPFGGNARGFSARIGRHSHHDRTGGLCTNCDLRLDCAFPVPEGGVWHCEEFL